MRVIGLDLNELNTWMKHHSVGRILHISESIESLEQSKAALDKQKQDYEQSDYAGLYILAEKGSNLDDEMVREKVAAEYRRNKARMLTKEHIKTQVYKALDLVEQHQNEIDPYNLDNPKYERIAIKDDITGVVRAEFVAERSKNMPQFIQKIKGLFYDRPDDDCLYQEDIQDIADIIGPQHRSHDILESVYEWTNLFVSLTGVHFTIIRNIR